MAETLMDKIVSLCKRRGFIFPGSEIYGGLANSWDYGPLGVELKNNIKNAWWSRFVHRRDDIVGLDSALIMNPKVWEASGHLENFSDPLVECKKCHQRFRGDQVPGIQVIQREKITDKQFGKTVSFIIDPNVICPNCGANDFAEPQSFNLLLRSWLGPIDEYSLVTKYWDPNTTKEEKEEIFNQLKKSRVYLRPETAQGMFVDFKNVLDTTRKTLPFGIAQIGKAFRNEITPGNFIFRTREFEQMEIEYFIPAPKSDKEWQKHFADWQKEMWSWMTDVLSLKKNHVHELEIPDGERAHYSKRTIDFEYDFPFGKKELYGLAYRTDFDLKNHFKEAPYQDRETEEKFWPHVVEPTWGVDRSVLAVLCDSYTEESNPEKSPKGDHGAGRVYLKLPVALAPYKAAVFPLLANKPQLVELARKIYGDLRKGPAAAGMVAWDERGNIGKRYYAQDEIGTPYCITVDFDSLEKGDVTVRDRDTAKQERVAIKELESFLREKVKP